MFLPSAVLWFDSLPMATPLPCGFRVCNDHQNMLPLFFMFLLLSNTALWDQKGTDHRGLPSSRIPSYLLSRKCPQQAGCLLNTTAEHRQLTPNVSHYAVVMHLCGCAIDLSKIPRYHSIPSLSPSPAYFFLAWGHPSRRPLQSWICRLHSADTCSQPKLPAPSTESL